MAKADARQPGARPGLLSILAEQFGVAPEPVTGRARAVTRIREKIVAAGVPCERLDVSDEPVRRGALFDMGGSRVDFPEGEAYESCYVGLIDPAAEAQWAHPAHWAFVPAAEGAEVILLPTHFPPHARGPVRLLPASEP